MKNLYLTISLILAFWVSTIAQPHLLDSANAAYARNDFEHAATLYENVLASGVEASGLYYNMGNVYYKLKQVPLAILYYEKALRINPSDEDARFNLQMAQRFVVDKIDALPELFLTTWFVSIINLNSSDSWAIYCLISFILMLALLALFFFSKSRGIKKIGFSGALLGLFLSLAFIGFAHYQHKWAVDLDFAIVVAPSTTIKSTPDQSGTDLFLIHEGLKVNITDKVGDWVEIKLSNGNKGWMPENGIRRI